MVGVRPGAPRSLTAAPAWGPNSETVASAVSICVTFMRERGSIGPGFADAEAVQTSGEDIVCINRQIARDVATSTFEGMVPARATEAMISL